MVPDSPDRPLSAIGLLFVAGQRWWLAILVLGAAGALPAYYVQHALPTLYKAQSVVELKVPPGDDYAQRAYVMRGVAAQFVPEARADSLLQAAAVQAGLAYDLPTLRTEVATSEVPNSTEVAIDVSDRRAISAERLADALAAVVADSGVPGRPEIGLTITGYAPGAYSRGPVLQRTAAGGVIGLLVGLNAAALIELRRRRSK